jgi:predicted negative regulator of RcsB-dependent stress response
MQAQDATTVYLLKLWPWFEENKKAIIAGSVIVIIVAFFFWFSTVQSEQKQIEAGQAVSQLLVSRTGESSDGYLKIASDYPGTIAGQRAMLAAATLLFDQGNYADAQTQFQHYIDAHPDGQFFTQALLGNAASLAAQGQLDQAVTAYQRVLNSANRSPELAAAKFAIAGIEESQGHLGDAVTYYEDVAGSDTVGPLGAEARQRLMDLRAEGKLPSSPTGAPNSPGQ